MTGKNKPKSNLGLPDYLFFASILVAMFLGAIKLGSTVSEEHKRQRETPGAYEEDLNDDGRSDIIMRTTKTQAYYFLQEKDGTYRFSGTYEAQESGLEKSTTSN